MCQVTKNRDIRNPNFSQPEDRSRCASGIPGRRKPIERESRFGVEQRELKFIVGVQRETNVVSEGSSHLPSIFPLTDSETANEWTRRGRTHPIQRSHTHAPSALSVLDEKFVPHTVGTCLNYSLFKRETKKGMREERGGRGCKWKGWA